MSSEAPNSLAAFLVWIATGPGITALVLWINSWSFWTLVQTDSDFLQLVKKAKTLVLVLLAGAAGVAATLITTYTPPDVIANLEPFYKLFWTAVNIVISLEAGQVVIFRIHIMKANLELRTEEKRAAIQATREAIAQFTPGKHG